MSAGTLPTVETMGGRARPVLVVEQKHDVHFDPAQHPRAHDGRFSHTPGAGWRIAAGRYRATSVSNLRPGDTIFTGGDSQAELPKPVGTTDSVVPAHHRRQRTVERVEQGDAGTTVHFTDGTSVTEAWANHPVYAPRDAKPPEAPAAPPESPAAKDGGVPAGWSRVGADAKEQEWRKDARSMYDALKADGVDLPDFPAYYARVTERTGMKFDAGNDLTRKVGKTQVTINVGDLPQEHWARAAQDIEAVVGRDDAKDEVTFTFRTDSFKDQPGVYGYTSVGANHVQVHPAIYTDEAEISTTNLMRSARGHIPRYVIAHEYGHARGAGHGHDREVRRAAVHTSGASLYAMTPGPKGPAEAAAEAYAEWSMTDGATPNEFAKAVADLEGWQ